MSELSKLMFTMLFGLMALSINSEVLAGKLNTPKAQAELWTKVTQFAASGWFASGLVDNDELQQLKCMAEKSDHNAEYALGMIYQQRSEYDSSAYWLRRAAHHGHVPAQYALQYIRGYNTGYAGIDW